ncbi:MAG: AbrB/MazE/SpoVT family DNA-binding domain-containing protein [Elusimicrobia bacterium]|nr:AbrB/MazE/SpoVT family DNA-binding domain-containing protein [Elusimicrobiota bacterium]
MSTKIRKWGNSLGVRIPKAAADASLVCEGSVVEVVARRGEIVIRPLRKPRYRLDELLAKITHANLPDPSEYDFGPPVGKEVL